jgi:hypothetical protein
MKKFEGFGDAAVLYSKYASIVDAIYQEFLGDITNFLDSLGEQIKDIISPFQLQEKTTSGYRYWWIAPNAGDKDSYPQLFFSSALPEIVKPGVLRLTACAECDGGRSSGIHYGEQLRWVERLLFKGNWGDLVAFRRCNYLPSAGSSPTGC